MRYMAYSGIIEPSKGITAISRDKLAPFNSSGQTATSPTPPRILNNNSQGRRTGDVVRDPKRAVQRVGNPGVEIDLNDDRHREQQDDDRLPHDLLALEPEQQDERRQQREERDRPKRARAEFSCKNWLRGQDLNLRPSGYEPEQ
jgi:hypothetical protein